MGLLQYVSNLIFDLLQNGIYYDPLKLLDRKDSIELLQETIQLLSSKEGTLYWPVYHGSFEEVKREIKSREDPQTILLIYFHSKDHPCVGHLRTNILCNKDVSQHFDHPRLISWIADVSTHPVYYELADKLGYHGYFPAFVFFGDFKGKLKMIKSISGNVTSDVLIAALNEIFEVFAMRSALMDHDAVQQTDDRVIRQDQDEAYRLSLEADRQKKIERIRKQELERQRDEEESRKQQDILAKNADKSAILARLKESISPEPASDDKDVITLCIQLIGGKRITRRFLKKTLLRQVYHVCAVEFDLHPESFTIKVPIPVKILEDMEKTLEHNGITANVKLIAEINA